MNQKLDIQKLEEIKEDFFQRDTITVAKELPGKIIYRQSGEGAIAGRIIETEAYLHENDMASHSAPGLTKRNAPMFESGGILYVYIIYGIHFCINLVTGEHGKGSAVLIRAIEPIDGIELMKRNRSADNINILCKGPGNLAKAFGYNLSHNYIKVGNIELKIYDDKNKYEIVSDKRIGIKKSADLPLRFYIKGSKYKSR